MQAAGGAEGDEIGLFLAEQRWQLCVAGDLVAVCLLFEDTGVAVTNGDQLHIIRVGFNGAEVILGDTPAANDGACGDEWVKASRRFRTSDTEMKLCAFRERLSKHVLIKKCERLGEKPDLSRMAVCPEWYSSGLLITGYHGDFYGHQEFTKLHLSALAKDYRVYLIY